MSPIRGESKSDRSAEDKPVQVDLVAKSIELAWSSKTAEERYAYMVEAVVYAIRENTHKLEEIAKTLASYD
jgi:hypothetical protein